MLQQEQQVWLLESLVFSEIIELGEVLKNPFAICHAECSESEIKDSEERGREGQRGAKGDVEKHQPVRSSHFLLIYVLGSTIKGFFYGC